MAQRPPRLRSRQLGAPFRRRGRHPRLRFLVPVYRPFGRSLRFRHRCVSFRTTLDDLDLGLMLTLRSLCVSSEQLALRVGDSLGGLREYLFQLAVRILSLTRHFVPRSCPSSQRDVVRVYSLPCGWPIPCTDLELSCFSCLQWKRCSCLSL